MEEVKTITKLQARIFLLLKQGLLGEHIFKGKEGVYDFINQRGSIQYDPIDVCGKSPELVLFSRVKNFTKNMLYHLLYQDRKLFDYFDKEMSIIPLDRFNYFDRVRESFSKRHQNKVDDFENKIIEIVSGKEYFSTKDLPLLGKIDWWWKPTDASKVVLEVLYHKGFLMIHHKVGAIKLYTFTSNIISNESVLKPKIEDDFEYLKLKLLERIGAVGIIWNKASSAFLGVKNFKSDIRSKVFDALVKEGKLIMIKVQDIKYPLYILKEDEYLLSEEKINSKYLERVEFLAPLDNLLWDRQLIKEIFDFEYTWEIYTPVAKRKYGHYVLPLLYGNMIIGRIEIVKQKNKALVVKNLWLEPKIKIDKRFYKKLLDKLELFKIFNGCEKLELSVELSNIITLIDKN